MKASRIAVAIGTAFLLAGGVLSGAQAGNGTLTARVAYGERTYLDKCASCHGREARGDGPVAEQLSAKPSNLRLLAKQNGGDYPFAKVYTVVDGRASGARITAHGTGEMPIWGKHFRADAEFGRASADDADEVVHGRILGLVYYLQTLQEK